MSHGSEDATTDLGTGEGDVYLRLARDVERFEKAWGDGAPFPPEDLLRGWPEEYHGELLGHALVVELLYRRGRGETPAADEYEARFPLHAGTIRQAFDDARTSPPVARALAPPPFPARIGKYAVLERLGAGGQGSAFLARDPDLGQLVVLKRYHGGADDLALQEAQKLTRVRSRHTARCLGLERDGGELYLIMEYIPGRSLASLLSEAPPAPDAAAKLIEQVAEGLEAVHACGLLHRDLKPSNIVVGDDGVPRLVDFGLAAHLGSAALQGVSGTAPYMAPEQARGEWARIDFRTDVYGLGATLYNLLTRVPPHPGGATTDALVHARKGVVTPPSELDPASSAPHSLERVVMKALAADPTQRYATAGEFRQALRRYRLRRRRRAAIGLLSLAGLILLLIGIWWRPDPQPILAPRAPLSGELTVRVWSPEGGVKRGWRVEETGALPVLPGEQIHLEAHLNRPAYAYILWLDGQGKVVSLYPWSDRAFRNRPSAEAATTVLHSPPELDRGWPMEGSAGLETALLLVRETPLPPGTDLSALIGRLPPSPLRDPLEVAVRGSDPGQSTGAIARGEHRGLGDEAERIDDPLLQVMERLRSEFAVIRAVRFAYRGE